MGRRGSKRTPILPPPAGTILLYAADGLAQSRGQLNRSGKPRTPARDQWVPLFRTLVESKEGLVELQHLATAGMQGWGCPPSLTRCLDDAFADITFRPLLIAALDDLAATARDKIVMPVPSAPPTPTKRTEPRQAAPQDKPQPPTGNQPQRPMNRNRPGMKPLTPE